MHCETKISCLCMFNFFKNDFKGTFIIYQPFRKCKKKNHFLKPKSFYGLLRDYQTETSENNLVFRVLLKHFRSKNFVARKFRKILVFWLILSEDTSFQHCGEQRCYMLFFLINICVKTGNKQPIKLLFRKANYYLERQPLIY